MSEPTHATQPEPTVPDDASARTHDSDPEPSQGPEHDVPRFTELVADFRTCMFSTIGPDGLIHSRPMAIQEVATDGTVWFFGFADAPKLAQLDTPAGVNLTFGNDMRFVSVSGSATVVDDLAKKRELWNPFAKAWFQTEADDPMVALIRFDPSGGEYWDGPGRTGQAIGLVKALLGKGTPADGDNAKLDLG